MAGKRAKSGAGGRGLAACALGLVCALALAGGALLDRHMPRADTQSQALAKTAALRINEVMTSNASAHKSDAGAFSDWVEIVNTSDAQVDLRGCMLRRTDAVAAVFTFPAQVLLPGECALVYCDGFNRATRGYPLHAAYRLSAAGVGLELLDSAGVRLDAVAVPELTGNQVYRRDGSGAWEKSFEYTPGLGNTLENYLSFEVEAVESAVAISEVMAANRTYAPDAQGRCHDYIEIFNASAEAVDLGGCFLTDNEADPRRWSFPEGTVLPAGGYLLIYASGLETGEAGELHAPFKLNSEGETVLLSDARLNALARLEIPALAPDQACSLVEGEYVTAFAPTPGLANTEASSDAIRAGLEKTNAAQVYISEIMAASQDTAYDWMEIVNASDQMVDISGWGLSDEADSPRKWQFPQGTYLQSGQCLALFMAGFDGQNAAGALYASFRLSAAGGYALTLSDAAGNLLDRVFVPEQYGGVAYARMDGGFFYTQEDTPNAENPASGYRGRAAKPVFSVAGGLFAPGEQVTVEISAAPGARIYYTLDCEDPDESAALYTGPITVSETTVVRARVYEQDMLPSYTHSQTYLYTSEHTMRVVCLVADPDNLTGETGIYSNYTRDWEREGHVEVYTRDGGQMLSQNCGLKLHGADSRRLPQKNFKVIARSEYGANRFAARLFEGRDYAQYQSFILRSSSEDGPKTRMRDSILTSLAEGTGVFYQQTELCVVYINGQYWGHYNMRERICAASICQYEGWEGQEDEIDLVKGNATVMRGSDDTYQQMLSWVKENGVPDDATLEKVGEVIDLDNYIAYHALQIFVGNADTLNVKRYRNASADGKWRYIIYDLDWGFYVDTNSIRRWLDPGGMGASKRTDNSLFIALMKNPTFYDRFLTFMGEMLATQWTTRNILDKIETRYNELLPELPRQFARWNQTEEEFREEMTKLVNYTRTRPRKLIGYFHDSLGLDDAAMEKYFGDAIRLIQEEDAA